MSSIPFHNQWYSDIIVYDERKKYYYTWARKNRPFLDDEIRNMGLGLLDQTRRLAQHVYGNVGSPTEPSSNKTAIGANIAFQIQPTSSPSNDFIITGGVDNNGNIEQAGILYIDGYYVFLMNNIKYSSQKATGSPTQDGYTETNIPILTNPSTGSDRLDIIYVDLHFSEASATTGADISEYQDLNLRNPIIGTETANRARAVFDIRVWEDWRFLNADGSNRSSPCPTLDQNIFTSADFLGAINTQIGLDPNPMDKHYMVPIALLVRHVGVGASAIQSGDIVNLLDLYDKRMYDLQEVTYKLNHGGFTTRDVSETTLFNGFTGFKGLTGTVSFTPRYSYAKVDESANATGANDGLCAQAYNTNSVTPRVVSKAGKFEVNALMVGKETGVYTYPVDPVTGPEQLCPGELVARELSAKSIYVGYDRGITGVRQYTDRLNVNTQGMTGGSGLDIINTIGVTGVYSATITTNTNSTYIDYLGRIGVDTSTPGWSGPAAIWDTARYSGTSDAVTIALDVNASERVTQHLFVDKDLYVAKSSYGQSWKLPGTIDRNNPALIGITGVPKYGLTGSPASLQVVPGIAVIGVTGSLAGYTGTFGFFEAYDSNGERLYTIGSRGPDYDRQVLSLYGTSERPVYISDADFLKLEGSFAGSPLMVGDIVEYDISLINGGSVTGTVGPLTYGGYSGLSEVANQINSPTGAGFYRTFTYEYAVTRNYGDTGPITYITQSGEAYGAALDFEDPVNNQYLKFLLKSMPEIDLGVNGVSFIIQRQYHADLPINFLQEGYYGSGNFGGDIIDLRFLKMDLGEGADGWLLNGDVYINGGGLLNKFTVSPIAMFRDDVYIYGKLVADRIMIQLATFSNLQVDRDAQVTRYLSVLGGVAEGFGQYSSDGIAALQNFANTAWSSTYDILHYINGGLRASNINLYGSGLMWELQSFRVLDNIVASVIMGGSLNSSPDNFGIHLIDSRVNPVVPLNTFTFDGSGGNVSTPTTNNILLWIKGDLQVGAPGVTSSTSIGLGGGILAQRLTLGTSVSTVDPQYILSVKNGNAYIQSLTVSSLQYDASNPSSTVSFSSPQNITVVQNSRPEVIYNKSSGILRHKEFSIDTFTSNPINFQNTISLGTTDTFDYGNISTGKARWANDTLTFTQEIINFLSSSRGDKTITVTDYNVPNRTISNTETWKFYRDNFSRVIVANMGTLNIRWDGYVGDTKNRDATSGLYSWINNERNMNLTSNSGVEPYFDTNPIITNGYTFSSPLFKFNQNGTNAINWDSCNSNFVANIRASFSDNTSPINSLYNLNKSLGVYIPENFTSNWKVRERRIVESGGTFYERLLYYPYFSRIINFNSVIFEQQYPSASGNVWEAAIFPRIVRQTYYGPTGSTDNVLNTYEADWEIDIIIYPVVTGTCFNLSGDLIVSYM
jgi:hypothetical protein